MSTKNLLQIYRCPQMKICHLHPNQTFHQPLQALHSITLVQTDLCRTMSSAEKVDHQLSEVLLANIWPDIGIFRLKS